MRKSDDFWASSPPLEAKRLRMSELATAKHDSTGSPLALSFVDVRKADFKGMPKRSLRRVSLAN